MTRARREIVKRLRFNADQAAQVESYLALQGIGFIKDLVNLSSSDERIDSVYTDGAYDTKLCRYVILDRQACAVIQPRKKCKVMER